MTKDNDSHPIYLDPSHPLDERVQDLIGRMTLPEKLSQMQHGARAVPRLGIPAYNFWSESLHGVARSGRATVFPQAIGLAATWSPELLQRIASAIGDEGRAKFHAAQRRRGSNRINQGLTFWAPNINIFRDPRWGRGQETYGEDPHLTGEMGVAYVRGLQGDDPRYLKAAACAKHYAVHSGPEKERHSFDARISKREMHDTYLPAFKRLVTEAGVEAVMGAYNRVNGEPCCAHPYLLGELLRGEWKFQGHVVSDCWALVDIHMHHHVTAGPVESAALALTRGCDLACGSVFDVLDEALARGLVSEADLDQALARTLGTRFKLGMFDPPEQVPYAAIPPEVIGCDEHRRLAREAAQKSVVLLKNKNNLLPIRPDANEIFVTGPAATNLEVLMANYEGYNDSMSTLLEGIIGRAPEGVRVAYSMGVDLVQPRANEQDWDTPNAASADVTIACVGLSPLLEGEEGASILSRASGDRPDIGLPAVQVSYIKKLAAAGAHIVLVVVGGSPITLGEVEEYVEAILFAWYPGQEGGRAVADVLFGDVSPSGKLPLTFPKSLSQLPPFEEYGMAGRTYRYMDQEPLYPFGFGLSYTCFSYHGLKLSRRQAPAGEPVQAAVTVQNSGGRAAEEVVQVYLSDLQASVPAPRCKLVAFQRIALQPGESQELEFTITPEAMMLVDEDGRPKLEPGEFRLEIGSCSPGARGQALGAAEPVRGVFEVVG